MAYDLLTPTLRHVAETSLRFLEGRFGSRGLRIETAIAPQIPWTPTFFLKQTPVLTVAVEVTDVVYPAVLKMGAYELRLYPEPVAVVIACPHSVYIADRNQNHVRELREHGFGLISVDRLGNATLQIPYGPLAQHISERELVARINDKPLRQRFLRAHQTYCSNTAQGLQEVGQIVEAMVGAIAKGCGKKYQIAQSNTAAGMVDELYSCKQITAHRAALGGARHFIKEYRNMASHPSKSSREAKERIVRCRDGFLEGVQVATGLRAIMRAEKIQLRFED